MKNASFPRWIIDPALDLPLAIIEDTEDGQGVCEIGERTPENMQKARLLVAAPKLAEALQQVQIALACHRDGIEYVHPVHGKLALEEVKYCVVDAALANLNA